MSDTDISDSFVTQNSFIQSDHEEVDTDTIVEDVLEMENNPQRTKLDFSLKSDLYSDISDSESGF